MKTVLFVCSANTCRSPMAEMIFDELIDEHPRLRGKVRSDSAGILAFDGDDITPLAREALLSIGIDGSRHRAKRVNKRLIEEASIILTMEAHHIDELKTLYPQCERKTHTLKGYVEGVMGYLHDDGLYDIDDPYRRTDIYEEVASDIKEEIDKLLILLEEEVEL